MFAADAAAGVLASLRSASRDWDSRCVDHLPTPVRDHGSRQCSVSLRDIHGLRRNPLEQVEVSAPHGAMGELLPLQSLLKSYHHRTSLRPTISIPSPRRKTPLPLAQGSGAVCEEIHFPRSSPSQSRIIAPFPLSKAAVPTSAMISRPLPLPSSNRRVGG